jgi:hypothetical protein
MRKILLNLSLISTGIVLACGAHAGIGYPMHAFVDRTDSNYLFLRVETNAGTTKYKVARSRLPASIAKALEAESGTKREKDFMIPPTAIAHRETIKKARSK